MSAITIGFLQLAAATAFTAYQQKRLRAKARQQYNDSLRDRLQMIDITPDSPRTLVLGRVRCVEGVRRRWATGEHEKNLTLIVSFAGHECDGFEKFYLDDGDVTLNAEGWVTTPKWCRYDAKPKGVTLTFGPGGTVSHTVAWEVLANSPDAVFGAGGGDGGGQTSYPVTLSSDLKTMTVTGGTPGQTFSLSWQESTGKPLIRIRTWLGAPGQNVGAVLAAEYPGKITATDRFEGMTLAVVDLEYDDDVLPNGPPNITALLRGAKILDPRTGVTAWSDNSALCAYYYARYSQGWALPDDVIRGSDVIAAANESDISTVFTQVMPNGTPFLVTLPRYRCGIVIPDGTDPREAMDDIMDTMAGRWGWAGGTWRFRCGMSAAPVFALTPDWVAQRLDEQGNPVGGPVVQISNGVPRESKLNMITGSCVDQEQRWQVLPFPAVEDEVLIAREGEYAAEVYYAGVNHNAHAQHLSAIRIREAQAPLRIEVACNYSAYEAELFDTGAVILPRYGMTAELAKAFEVVGWKWHPTEAVRLQLAETSAAIYEPGELRGLDPAPDTTFPSPFAVPDVEGLAADSGTAQLLRSSDGSLLSRILVVWNPVEDEAVRSSGGGFDIRYGPLLSDPETWAEVSVRGDMSQAHLTGVQDGFIYGVTVRARNSLVRGKWARKISHLVLGKTAPPRGVPYITAEVTGDGVLITIPENPDLDRAGGELRVGGLDWGSATPLVGSVPTLFPSTTYLWPRPAPGTYRIRARYIDTTGNDSISTATVDVVVTEEAAMAWMAIVGRPRTYRLISRGYQSQLDNTGPGPAQFQDVETGAVLHSPGFWGMQAKRKSDGAIVAGGSYATLVEPSVEIPRLIADINALTPDVWVILYTNDEPFTHTLATSDFVTALLRCGARRSTLSKLQFRGAYQLIGTPGVGEGGALHEDVRGDFYSDPKAWLDTTFQYYNGQLLGLSSSNGAINAATSAAADAAAAASAAAVAAAAALADIDAMASDGVLSRLEKSRAQQDWDVLTTEQAGINAQADNYAVVGAKATYNTELGALASYLVSLSPAWNDFTTDTPISGSAYRTRWAAAFAAKQALLDAISAAAKARLGALATLNEVDTPQIVNEAATSIYPVSFTGVAVTGFPGVGGTWGGPMSVAVSLTFTAPATGEVLLTVDAVATTYAPSGVSMPTNEFHAFNTGWLINGVKTGGEKRYHGSDVELTPSAILYASFVRSMRISVIQGSSYTVQLVAQAPQLVAGTYPIGQYISGEMRGEMIKK